MTAIIATVVSIGAVGQAQEVAKASESAREELHRQTIDEAVAQLRKGDLDGFYAKTKGLGTPGSVELRRYLEEPDAEVRKWVLIRSIELGMERDGSIADPNTTQLLIKRLSGTDSDLAAICRSYLERVMPQAFDQETRKMMLPLVEELEKQPTEVVLAMGVANLEEAKPKLREIAANPPRGNLGIDWNAKKALARMGDQHYAAEVVRKFKQEMNPDKKYVRNLEELAYIGGNQAILALGEVLMSDDKAPILGSESDVLHPVACRVAPVMAKLIEDFPIKKTWYKEEDMPRLREWWSANRQRFKSPPEAPAAEPAAK
ncbi:MAG: hypothetical protein WD042_04055 [Phycisphaeraceae bacterium]